MSIQPTQPRRSSKRKGFTLVEVLLVLVIIVLSGSIAVPMMARSIKGARIRTSARAVTLVNRYARTIAVLKQKKVAVIYHKEKNTIEMKVAPDRGNRQNTSYFLNNPRGDEDLTGGGEDDFRAAKSFQSVRERKLEDRVSIEDFEGVDMQQDAETSWVYYYPNGMCDPHEFKLVDESGVEVEFEIESITGGIKLEYSE